MSDKDAIPYLIDLASNPGQLQTVEQIAARKLLDYDGEVYPSDGCAITLSILLQQAGISVPDTFQAIELARILKEVRNWTVIKVGDQHDGDIGSTCGTTPDHGQDHIYLVLRALNIDEMVIADNQSNQPHFRYASGIGGKTPTKYFLRAPE
ncbi:hypothetical protein [Burkholderia contaminans]|uniref:Uncharacterized protein n=1 Tax=Burkholderia contaminans TaxID=488447 RepID=A0AAP4R9G7_9BURK|nr:hypothetical protein [Burkholderia contaminans]MDN7569962.1 hypothetical protein [Burkholderia contaminans]